MRERFHPTPPVAQISQSRRRYQRISSRRHPMTSPRCSKSQKGFRLRRCKLTYQILITRCSSYQISILGYWTSSRSLQTPQKCQILIPRHPHTLQSTRARVSPLSFPWNGTRPLQTPQTRATRRYRRYLVREISRSFPRSSCSSLKQAFPDREFLLSHSSRSTRGSQTKTMSTLPPTPKLIAKSHCDRRTTLRY